MTRTRTDLLMAAVDALVSSPLRTDEPREVTAGRAVLDAVLPIIGSPDALNALGTNSKVLSADGRVWTRDPWGMWVSDSGMHRSSETPFAMRVTSPLTLIWETRRP